MSDLNRTNLVSKTFSLELDTGQTRTIRRGQGPGRPVTTPITLRVPNLSTVSSYNVAEDGAVSNVNTTVRQVITRAQYDTLPDSLRSSERVGPTRGARTRRTKYYATLATRDGETKKYTYTDAVDKVLPEDTATLFKRDVAKENKGETSQFSTVSAATQQAITKEEGLNTGDPRNGTGLSPSIPSNVDTAPQTSPIPDFKIKGKPTRRKYPDLRYPKERHETQDYIQFKMLEYKGITLGNVNDFASLTVGKTREFGPIEGSVTLPMQSKISDINTVNWGETDLNPLQAIGLGILGASDPFKQVNNIIEQLKEDRNSVTTNALTAGKVLAFQEAIQVKGLLARTTGAILNPNTELLFRGPQLRPFGFSFFLAARSQSEASEIKQIIRFFKQGMSIKESSNNLFLKTPNVFNIRYVYGATGQDHPGLNRIKTCALRSCSVDYNPDNTFMTFEDGTMTAYRITMQFQELLPITESDYLSNSGPLADPEEAFKQTNKFSGEIGF